MNYTNMMSAIPSGDAGSINKMVAQQIASRKAQYDLYLDWAYKNGIAPVSMNYFVTNYNNIVEANKDKGMNVPLWMSDKRIGSGSPAQVRYPQTGRSSWGSAGGGGGRYGSMIVGGMQ